MYLHFADDARESVTMSKLTFSLYIYIYIMDNLICSERRVPYLISLLYFDGIESFDTHNQIIESIKAAGIDIFDSLQRT